MEVEVICPGCQKKMLVPEDQLETELTCQHCGNQWTPPPRTSVSAAADDGECCPKCDAVMPSAAKLCTNCGYNFKTGLSIAGTEADEEEFDPGEASLWEYYKPLLLKFSILAAFVIVIGGGALGLKALVRQHTREQVREELKTQIYDTNGITDRIRNPENHDLLIEAYIEAPSLRPAAGRFIRQAKLYRDLFEEGYNDLPENDRIELVKSGLEWKCDFSGELVEALDEDYEDVGTGLRQQIIQVLAVVGGNTSVARLEDKFAESSPTERASIVEALVTIEDPGATETLVQFYQDTKGKEKQFILSGLARKAAPASLAFVRKTMENGSAQDRKMGYVALTAAGAPALNTAVQVACHTDEEIRRTGAEAVAEILKLLPRPYVLRICGHKSGDYEKKRKRLETLQREAPFCHRYAVSAVGTRRVVGTGGSGAAAPYTMRLSEAGVSYDEGVLTVQFGEKSVVAEITGGRSFVLDMSCLNREGFPAAGRRVRCTIEDDKITGEFIGGPLRESISSSDTYSYYTVSYNMSQLLMK